MRLPIILIVALLGAGCKKKDKPKEPAPAADEVKKASVVPSGVEQADPAAGKKVAEAPPPKTLRLTVKSKPSGAELTVDGKPQGPTPATFEVIDDKRDHEFLLTKDGYATYKFSATPVRDGLLAHIELKPIQSADAGP